MYTSDGEMIASAKREEGGRGGLVYSSPRPRTRLHTPFDTKRIMGRADGAASGELARAAAWFPVYMKAQLPIKSNRVKTKPADHRAAQVT